MSEILHEALRQRAHLLAIEIVGAGPPSDVTTVRSRDLYTDFLLDYKDLREKLETQKHDLALAVPVGKKIKNLRWVNEVDRYCNPDGRIGHYEGTVVAG